MILGCGHAPEKDVEAREIERLAEALENADAVLVGAGAGLSTAASPICTRAGFTLTQPLRNDGRFGAATSW